MSELKELRDMIDDEIMLAKKAPLLSRAKHYERVIEMSLELVGRLIELSEETLFKTKQLELKLNGESNELS